MDVTYIMRNLLSETTGMNLLANLALFTFIFVFYHLYDHFSWVTQYKITVVSVFLIGYMFGHFLSHAQ